MNYRRNKMKCPHLMKWITFLCKANKEVYSPSPFQLEEYCKREEHKKCPFLVRISDINLENNYFVIFS